MELPLLLDSILNTVQQFRRDAVQNDDLSVLVLRFLGGGQESEELAAFI